MKNELINLAHLRQAALEARGLISQVAGASAEAVEELSGAKQDKLTGAAGQIVGFDESGAAVAQEAPGGTDWDKTPWTDMAFSSTSNYFVAMLCKISRMAPGVRTVSGMLLVNVKTDAYAGSWRVSAAYPEDFPAAVFSASSLTLSMQGGGASSIACQMEGKAAGLYFTLNPEAKPLSGGLYADGFFTMTWD